MNKLFDQQLTIFLIPLLIGIFSFIKAKATSDWAAIAFAVWIVVSIIAIVLTGVFLLLNHYFIKWKMNWWKNALLSVGLWLLGMILLVFFIRISG